MKLFFGFICVIFIMSAGLTGCDEKISSYESTIDTIFIHKSDTLTRLDTLVKLDTTIKKTVIETNDTIFEIDSIFTVDTIKTFFTDTVIHVDTIKSFIHDTVHSIDTLFIPGQNKTVFVVSVDLKNDTPYMKIKCNNFNGEIPKLLYPEGGFTLDVEGELSYTKLLKENSSKVLTYSIASGNDTLDGLIDMSDYCIDSMMVDDKVYHRRSNFYKKEEWDIISDFENIVTINWDRDSATQISREFYGLSEGYDSIRTYWYRPLGDTSITVYHEENKNAVFPVKDPLLYKISGNIKTAPTAAEGMKPAFESESMEVYHLIFPEVISFNIHKDLHAFNALESIGNNGWTAFCDSTNPILTINANSDRAEIDVNGSGYAIAHGQIIGNGNSPLHKVKQVYIRYEVSDSTDTVSLSFTSNMQPALDTVNWNCFRAVLTTGCNSIGKISTRIIDVLDLDDFIINWGGTNYPEGTTLNDDIAKEFLSSIEGIAISQESGSPTDTTFNIKIHDLYIIHD